MHTINDSSMLITNRYLDDVRVIVYHGIELNIDANLFLVHCRSHRHRGISLRNATALRTARSTTLAISLHLTLSGRTRRANSIKGSEIRTKKSAFSLPHQLQGVPEVGCPPLRIFRMFFLGDNSIRRRFRCVVFEFATSSVPK